MKKAIKFTNRFNLMMPAILCVIATKATGIFGQLTEKEKFFDLSGKNTIRIIAVICGLYIFLGAPEQSAAQIPQGSYLKTCTVQSVDSQNTTMVAKCRAKNDADYVRAFEYKYCVPGTIYNDNGTLHCTIDTARIEANKQKAALNQESQQAAEQQKKADAEQKQKADAEKQKAKYEKAAKEAQTAAEIKNAKAGFDSAAIIVIGRESKSGEIEQWVGLMKNDSKFAGKVAEGVGFNDAVQFLKQFISKPEGAAARAELIDNAFREVYGRRSTPGEQAVWDSEVKAQKTWYAPLVLAEIAKLNANAENRVIPIQIVYFLSFGIEPTNDQLNYWKARKEHFRPMIEANRNWLYTSDGAKDRQEAVRRALKSNNSGKVPTDDEIKQKMVEFTPNKTIYVEMIGKKISDFQ